ncbi:MAG: hypothetical protein RIR69_44 [Actinomycetota bacterium]
MTTLVSLHAHGQQAAWESLGLTFQANRCWLGDVSLVLTEGSGSLTGWTIDAGRDEIVDIDGIATTLVSSSQPVTSPSRIGDELITGLDHVVVNTDNLDRTCDALCAALGVDVRRERDAGRGVVQRFIKLSNTIIEVVTGPHITSEGASLWGMVISVDDMEAWAAQCGEAVTSPPKQATQPGRRISTVRSAVGLGVPFAVMTPHISSDSSSPLS